VPGARAKHVRRGRERPIALIDFSTGQRTGNALAAGDENPPIRDAAAHAPWRAIWSGPVADHLYAGASAD
jgi:hypothetical protein